MSNETILEMKGITKSFPGVMALDDVSLSVKTGSVHALLGENGAGKSTLMKCLFGLYSPDAGEIVLGGEKVHFGSAKDALSHGISMIHQELLPIPYRSVMENIWLGRYPLSGPLRLVNHKKMFEDTKRLFDELKIDLDPKIWVSQISVSKIQSMEIAKAVSFNSRVIIMDEPTSSLSENEVEHLFRIIRKLKAEGVAIIYISHKLDEILQIADEVTIMRDGKNVGTYPSHGLTTDAIISKMVGRNLENLFPPRSNVPGKVIMRVEGLSAHDQHSFKDVSFDLREGEILGISGLVGAQRTELMEALFGLKATREGSINLRGGKAKVRNPIDAIRLKMAFLTEERRSTGIFSILSVFDNTLTANWKSYVKKNLLLDFKKAQKDVAASIEKLRVKTPSPRTLMQDLSGGNQQKVIVSRWLLTEPDILILDEPTRGIDVGAKYEIYSIIANLAKQGKSIIMISSELPEILGMSDRILVMCEGRVTGIVDGKDADQVEIMKLSTQFM